MPISLPPLSRRRFLAGSLAAGAGWMAARVGWSAEDKIDPHRFALLADTHIAADAELIVRQTNMFKHLQHVVADVAALDARPAAVLVDGDCAYQSGESGDYQRLVGLLAPLREKG